MVIKWYNCCIIQIATRNNVCEWLIRDLVKDTCCTGEASNESEALEKALDYLLEKN